MNHYNNKIQVIHIKNIPSNKVKIKSQNEKQNKDKPQQFDLFEECLNEHDDNHSLHPNHTNNSLDNCLYAYIGRRRNLTKSITTVMDESFSVLCNPFRISDNNSRQEVLMAYRKYANEQMKMKGKFFKKIQELMNMLKNNQYEKIYLVCFCKPHDCHGDIVKEIVLQQLDDLEKQFSDNK